MSETLVHLSTNEIRVAGLHDTRTAQLLSGAVVTAVVKKLDGTPVTNGTVSSFTQLAAGEYSGVLGADAELVLHDHYEIHVTATHTGLTRVFVLSAVCRDG